MQEPETREYIDCEPCWDGLRKWALHGLQCTENTADERSAFDTVLNACDEARRAGRPQATWVGPTWGYEL
jgi:hypothetical protein